MEMRSDMENIVKKIINSGYQIEVDAVKLLNDIIDKMKWNHS